MRFTNLGVNLLLVQHLLHQMLQLQKKIASESTQQENQCQPQLHNQNSPNRTPARRLNYGPGILDRRVNQCIHDRKNPPADSNLEFWKKYVVEYFAPGAKNVCCLSFYGNSQQPDAIFQQAEWNCNICGRNPGRGFEVPYEVLPRFLQMHYQRRSLENLSVDLPREYQNYSGQVVLHYAKAVQDSVFANIRIMREGQLRVVFNPDQKISSWEFCIRRHEELIPRSLIMPQVTQLGHSVKNYRDKRSSSELSTQVLQDFCKSCQTCSVDLAETLKVPKGMHLGYSNEYVRALQITDVMKNMKELMDYSIKTGTGPRESLTNFARGDPVPAPDVGVPVNPASLVRQDLKGANGSGIDSGSAFRTLLSPEVSHAGAMANRPMFTNEIKHSNIQLDSSSMAFSGRDGLGHAACAAELPTNSNHMEESVINQQEQDFVNQFLVGEDLWKDYLLPS